MGRGGRIKTNASCLLRCLQDKNTWLREAESDLSLIGSQRWRHVYRYAAILDEYAAVAIL